MVAREFEPWPFFSEEEIEAVASVLRSNKVNYWTGQVLREFEQEFSTFAGSKYAIAVANGTVALDLILHGLGIGARNGGTERDEVIVTPRSFIASVSAIVNAGARPVFADLDPNTQNICTKDVADRITKDTRGIMAVHLAGWPCDNDGLKQAIAGREIHIIEDCAQAHGALYKGKPVGALGAAAAWSFCQDKIMTTGGEGGMVTCDDKDLWDRMWSYKDHGKSFDSVYHKSHTPGFRWLHDSFGTNFRMTEMQGAIGRIQLKRMPEWKCAREANAGRLSRTIKPFANEDGPLRLSDLTEEISAGSRHANYKFYMFVRKENLRKDWTRDRIVSEIASNGVPCMQGSCSEIYLEAAFEGFDFRPKHRLPVARELGETSIMMLVHPTLSVASMNHATAVLESVLTQSMV